MRLWNCIYIFVGMILITSQGVSEPSKPISSMMDTPASVFDVYLFRIWQKLECNDVQDIAPCMVRIEYQFDDNIIEMTFRILVSDDQMKEFETATDNQKENILINILGNLAIDVGVAYFKTMSI